MAEPSRWARSRLGRAGRKAVTAAIDQRVRTRALPGQPDVIVGTDARGLDGVVFEGRSYVAEGTTFTGDVRIGRGSTLSPGCTINGPVTIGRWCQLGPGVAVHTADHPTHLLTTYVNERLLGGQQSQGVERHRVTIGDDVWIGHAAVVLRGATVGPGAIVGAATVVTRDVPAYYVVTGNPAGPPRPRFDDRVTELLLALRWWELDDGGLEAIRATFLVDLREVGPATEALVGALDRVRPGWSGSTS